MELWTRDQKLGFRVQRRTTTESEGPHDLMSRWEYMDLGLGFRMQGKINTSGALKQGFRV